MYIDVKKAHLVPRCRQDVYVELPAEAEVGEDECGKLIYWLYGCRPAAQAWEEHYSGVLEAAGFRRLLSSPVAFYHPERDLIGVVHGDDFVFVGVEEDLDYPDEDEDDPMRDARDRDDSKDRERGRRTAG